MTQLERVLAMLRDAGDTGCTTAEFLHAYLPRFSARIEELRNAKGHTIRSERLRDGSWRYTLTRDAERGVETQTTAARSLHAPAASHEGQGNDSALDADTPTLFDVGRSTAAGSSYRDADAA